MYFGKRYLNTALQRWVSADPLEVHSAGEADANLYAYVSGKALRAVDPVGLELNEADFVELEMMAGNTMQESLEARRWLNSGQAPDVAAEGLSVVVEPSEVQTQPQDARRISEARTSGVKDSALTWLQGMVSTPPSPMLMQDPWFEEQAQRDVALIELARDPEYSPALEAARQEQALYSSRFLLALPFALRTPTFGFKPSYVGMAQLKSTDYARMVMSTTAKRKWPSVVSASVDLNTGTTAFAESGTKLFEGVPQLRLRMPGPQRTVHPAWNCAELRACNINLTAGVSLQQQEVHTLQLIKKTGTTVEKHRCANCLITTDGAKVTSD